MRYGTGDRKVFADGVTREVMAAKGTGLPGVAIEIAVGDRVGVNAHHELLLGRRKSVAIAASWESNRRSGCPSF